MDNTTPQNGVENISAQDENNKYYMDYMNFFVEKYNRGERSFYIDDTDIELINTFATNNYEWLASKLTNYPNDIDKTNRITLESGFTYYYYVTPFEISDDLITPDIKEASQRIINNLGRPILFPRIPCCSSYKKFLDDFLTGKNDDILYFKQSDIQEKQLKFINECYGCLFNALIPYCTEDYYFYILYDVCKTLDSSQKDVVLNYKNYYGTTTMYYAIYPCGFKYYERVLHFLLDIPELDVNIPLPNGKTFLTTTLCLEMMNPRWEEFHKKLIKRGGPTLTTRQTRGGLVESLTGAFIGTALSVLEYRVNGGYYSSMPILSATSQSYAENILHTLREETIKQEQLTTT